MLLKGPDQLPSLVGVILRFRQKAVGICGDIKEMFHQIMVREEDQGAQQFLWRYGDNSREPDRYVMRVMTFGASCSPAAANYVRDRNAKQFLDEHPKAVRAILRNTFVDDWLQSCESEEEMVRLAQEVRHIHKEGGFEMRGWISNSSTVMRALLGDTKTPERSIEMAESTTNERVLGMWWNPRADHFTFVNKFGENIYNETTVVTKRLILRIVMTIFDPLGLLGFYIIQAKLILQDV
ncbi:hypothetical protein KR084_005173, partial [Drosophila pseudotakahashii]